MNFSKEKIRDFYLITTEVENLFINEYMADAPGEYVKVYLFGLLYAQHKIEMSHQLLINQLRLSEKDVNDAWTYWEKMGVIKKIPNEDDGMLNYDVSYVNLREKMYGHVMSLQVGDEEAGKETAILSTTAEVDNSSPLTNNEVKDVFDYIEELTGEILDSQTMKEVPAWINECGISPEVIKAAEKHCYDLGKKNINYVTKVVVDWHERGFKTREECEAYVEEHQEQQEKYRKVLKSLGQYRQPTEGEKKLMKKWFSDMKLSMDKVLEACDQTVGTTNPSIKYIDKVLENKYGEALNNKSGNQETNQKKSLNAAVLNKYYEALRNKEEREAKERRLALYEVLPEVKRIDSRLSAISSEMARGLFTGLSKEKSELIRKERMELEKERAILLTENNFRIDHTDIRYSCDICKDTGITEDGKKCVCIEKRTKEAELWQAKKLEI